MPSLVLHPDTSYAPLRVPEALEVRVADRIYTLTAGQPTYIESADLAAVQAAITTLGGSLSTPGQPGVITQGGTGGAATWTYAVSASNDQGDSIESPTRSTSTGNATLTGTNFNTIPMPATQTGQDFWKIIRTVSGGTPASTGLIGTIPITQSSFNDTGTAASAFSNPGSNPARWGSRVQTEV